MLTTGKMGLRYRKIKVGKRFSKAKTHLWGLFCMEDEVWA